LPAQLAPHLGADLIHSKNGVFPFSEGSAQRFGDSSCHSRKLNDILVIALFSEDIDRLHHQIFNVSHVNRLFDFFSVYGCRIGHVRSIFVESPYVTFPFYDHLRDACGRGVPVTIITPKTNNWSRFADYAKWEATRCGVDLRLSTNGMSHLKALLIDDRYLVAGSSNFDFLSYHAYEEFVAIITDPSLIADFRRLVLAVDLANSEHLEEQAGPRASGWSRLRLKLFNKGLATLLE